MQPTTVVTGYVVGTGTTSVVVGPTMVVGTVVVTREVIVVDEVVGTVTVEPGFTTLTLI
jgi:hypothetical protein